MAYMWKAVRGRSVILAVTGLLVLSACNSQPAAESAAPAAAQAEPDVPIHTALGDFLAARVAEASGDSKASAAYYADALAHDPDNVALMQRTFILMVGEGQLDAAVPLARRLVDLDSDSPIPQMVLGVRAAIAGDYAKAETHFHALPQTGVNAFLGPLLSAWALVGEGHTDQALNSLRPLTTNAALGPLHAFHAGLINDLANRSSVAAKQYQLALATSQLNIRAVEAAGSLWQRTGRMDRAKDLYDRYVGEHPDTMLFNGAALLKAGARAPRVVADARDGLAEAMFDVATLMRQGNAYDYAMLFARLAVALQPDFSLAQMTLADLLSIEGRLAEANAVYRAIAPSSPVHTFGRLRIAMNLDDMGDTKGALAELDRLLADQPDNLDARIAEGDLLRKHKRFAEAADAYSEAIARLPEPRPEDWALYYSRGICLERAGKWPAAEADLLRALELQPDQPDVLNYLGYSWIDKGMHLDQARQMIEKAVELRPSDGAIVDSLGWALYRMGDYPAAVRMLERAVELKGDDPTINEHLGDAYWRVGRHDEARYQWRRALGLNPEPEQMEGLKEKVKAGTLPGPEAQP